MQKNDPIQKKRRLIIPALVAILILVLIFQTSLENPHHFIMGPYKAFALSFLLSVFFLSLDFCFYQRSRSVLNAWFFFFAGFILLGIFSLSQYLFPNSNRLAGLGRWSFFPVIICLFGIGLRLNLFFSLRKSNTVSVSQSFLIIFAVFFLFLSLLPILSGGFYWDDAIFATVIPAMRISGVSIWQRIKDEIISYSLRGRINPFATFQFLIFYLFPDVHVYKAILLILTIIDGLLFYKFNSELFKNQIAALAILLLLPLCIQLRIYHDPMQGYYGLMQMMFAELMISLICFNRYLENRKKKYLIISIIFFTIGLMSYEMFYPLLVLYFLLAWHSQKNRKQTLSSCIPFACIEAILLSVSFGFRSYSAKMGLSAYSGTTFSLDIGKILSTWFHQSLAALPLSYQMAGNDATILKRLIPASEIFSQSFAAFVRGIVWSDIVSLIVFLFLWVEIRKRIHLPVISGFHWAFGCTLLFGSGLVLALSEKYQNEILPGLGYLPVFFGYFGAAFLIFCLAANVYRLLKKVISADTILTFGISVFMVVFLLNQQSNRRSVALMNEEFLYPRQTGEAALQAGILKEADPQKEILVENNPFNLWEQEWSGGSLRDDFILLNSGLSIQTVGVDELKELVWDPTDPQGNVPLSNVRVLEYSGDRITGFAKMGKLVQTGFDESESLRTPIADDIRFFVRKGEKEPEVITWTTWDGAGHYAKISEQWLLKETPEGRLYKLDDPHAVYFDSIGLAGYQ
ncbi:MAG TPA: hypothetical protein PLX12_09135 [Flexilinea sp.]|nr:hypothetical protein [Flexilinea sp.]